MYRHFRCRRNQSWPISRFFRRSQPRWLLGTLAR